MRADKPYLPISKSRNKEVTMIRRSAVVAIAVAAFLILATPALAYNGARADYTTSSACGVCHTSGEPTNAPKVYNDWAGTVHAASNGENQGLSIPTGSVCAGCHTANYDPTKVVPTPTATATNGTITWAASIPSPFPAQTAGSAPYSEPDVGCSSCHYGAAVNGVLAQNGSDVNDTAHTAAFADLSNAEICGACHSRYSYTVGTYTVHPSATSTATIQPQMAIGYPMLGQTYQPLSSFLNVATPGWTPTPTATTAASLQIYWSYNGSTTDWPSAGHAGDAGQYPEWLSSKHSRSLTDLKAATGGNPPQACLSCHSADYQTAVTANAAFPGLNAPVPTGSQAKYGDTCVTCHTPHKAGQANSVFTAPGSGFDTQLVGDPANPSDLCTTCHTAGIAAGGIEPAGATVYEDQKEVMQGVGAIGVPNGLLVSHHLGACIDCHMPPTTKASHGANLGGNHTMEIIYPKVAASATAGGTTGMPFSSCSLCHSKPATSTNPTPDPLATTMQSIADARQAQMQTLYAQTAADLHAAGLRMGYQQPAASVLAKVAASLTYSQTKLTTTKNSPAAGDVSYIDWLNSVLNTKGAASWSSGELLWQKGYTDWTYVAAEGSWGIHNGPYTLLVINTADNFANQVLTAPQAITLKAYKSLLRLNASDIFSGTVNPASAGTITIQKKSLTNWLTWKTATVGSTGHFSIKVKMTKKGTYYFRAFFPAKPPYAGGISKKIKVVVK